ncbi:MAG: hypothetical protein D6741_11090, partial [Planctomycetota bacterium]
MESKKTDRRRFLNRTLLGTAAAGAALSLEEQILLAAMQQQGDADSGEQAPAKQEPLPCGKIKGIEISRMLIGGNLIGGWSHSRDLLYVSKLFKAYNTPEKVMETLALAEQHGINTIQIDPRYQDFVVEYNEKHGGHMQSLVCMMPDPDVQKMRDQIRSIVDKGATLLYTHGGVTEPLVRDGKLDVIAKALELIRAEGLPAGIGSHALEVPMAAEEHGLDPDFYVKTFHSDSYWSATPEEAREAWCWHLPNRADHDYYNDNMWCLNPEKTAEFMKNVDKPWIAFKVLAAGAIHPRMGFSYAFRNGADFIIVGMFDFQIAE